MSEKKTTTTVPERLISRVGIASSASSGPLQSCQNTNDPDLLASLEQIASVLVLNNTQSSSSNKGVDALVDFFSKNPVKYFLAPKKDALTASTGGAGVASGSASDEELDKVDIVRAHALTQPISSAYLSEIQSTLSKKDKRVTIDDDNGSKANGEILNRPICTLGDTLVFKINNVLTFAKEAKTFASEAKTDL